MKRFCKSIRKNAVSYLFLAPMFILFFIFSIIPAFQGIWYAFCEFSGLGLNPEFCGLQNFVTMAEDETFWISLRNTFILVLGVVPTSMIMALLVAVLANRTGSVMKAWVRAAFYLPVVVGGITLTLTWKYIFNPNFGAANYILSLFGLDPIVWLGDKHFALVAIIFVIFTYSIGQPLILFMNAMSGIPVTYYEASSLDGATAFTDFFRITLPLLKPTTLYVLITSTIGAFQVFVIVQLLTAGGPNNASNLLMYLLYQKAFIYGDYGVASCIGVVLLFICTTFAVLQYKLTASDVTY